MSHKNLNPSIRHGITRIGDGNLVTGQQNFSGGETANLIIEAVGR